MRAFALSAVFFMGCFASADVVGKWKGIVLLGPSKIAQTMDSDGLLKLQVSKAFLKTLTYEVELKPDHSYTTNISGADIDRKASSGKWSLKGAILTLSTSKENGAASKRVITASLNPDGKKWVVVIPSKPGLPISKLVFVRVQPATKPANDPAVAKPKKA